MKNLFIGFLFLFVDVTFSPGSVTFDILPDFIGYYFLFRGAQELKEKSTHFAQIRPIAIGMLICSLFTFFMSLTGNTITMELSIVAILLSLIPLLISLYISYQAVLGVTELETTSRLELNSEQLLSRWKFMAACQAASLILILVPIINLLLIIFSLASAILFLIAFNDSKKAYISAD